MFNKLFKAFSIGLDTFGGILDVMGYIATGRINELLNKVFKTGQPTGPSSSESSPATIRESVHLGGIGNIDEHIRSDQNLEIPPDRRHAFFLFSRWLKDNHFWKYWAMNLNLAQKYEKLSPEKAIKHLLELAEVIFENGTNHHASLQYCDDMHYTTNSTIQAIETMAKPIIDWVKEILKDCSVDFKEFYTGTDAAGHPIGLAGLKKAKRELAAEDALWKALKKRL